MIVCDLYCGAGGVSAGIHEAWPEAEIVGVDIVDQPHYPFTFVKADALKVDLRDFDYVFASPPCQKRTVLQHLSTARNGGYPTTHVDLIAKTRRRLRRANVPYVIENVVGAPLINPIRLCGTMFNLKVYRHRLFESNVQLRAPEHFPHRDRMPSVGNGISPKGFITVCGNGGVKGMVAAEILAYWRMAMGIGWMNRAELAQAIPPAYSRYIARSLKNALGEK